VHKVTSAPRALQRAVEKHWGRGAYLVPDFVPGLEHPITTDRWISGAVWAHPRYPDSGPSRIVGGTRRVFIQIHLSESERLAKFEAKEYKPEKIGEVVGYYVGPMSALAPAAKQTNIFCDRIDKRHYIVRGTLEQISDLTTALWDNSHRKLEHMIYSI